MRFSKIYCTTLEIKRFIKEMIGDYIKFIPSVLWVPKFSFKNVIAHQSKQKSLVCHVLHAHILILLDVMSIELQLHQLFLDSLSLSGASKWTHRGRCGHGCWLHGRMVWVESGSGWWHTARLSAEGLGAIFNHQRDHENKAWSASLLHKVSNEQFT